MVFHYFGCMDILKFPRLIYVFVVVVLLVSGAFFIYNNAISAAAPGIDETPEHAEQTEAEKAEKNAVIRNIVPHKALYRLKLTALHAGSPITEIGGEMYFKWEDVCDAWSTDHRFKIEYYYTDRPSVTVTNHFVAWEDKAGDRMHFLSEGYTDGVLDQKNRGEAIRQEDGSGIADYREPVGMSHRLPKGFYFPADHTIETIRQAMAGNSFFHAVMFDGTDDEGPSEINAFIDQTQTPLRVKELYDDKSGIDQSLLTGQYWDTRLAFFPLEATPESSVMPDYEMRVRLHENGVVSDIVVEYDKFSVRQELVALSELPETGC